MQVWKQPRMHEQVARGKSGRSPAVRLGEVGDGRGLGKKAWLGNVSDRKVFSWILPAFPS